MKRRWFTSDTHFGHKRIIEYCNRPFNSLEEMEAALIANWNSKIAPEDTIYVLGDVFFTSKEKAKTIMAQLNGYKILIRGNHDRKPQAMLDIGFNEVHENLEIELAGRKVKLSHYPYRPDLPEILVNKVKQIKGEHRVKGLDAKSALDALVREYESKGLISTTQAKQLVDYDLRYFERRYKDDGSVLLCGHVHNAWKTLGRMINVGCDVWNFMPVSEEELVTLINS